MLLVEIFSGDYNIYMKRLTIHDIGCKVKTPYGIGILIDVDARAAFYVKPLNKDEEWEETQFDGRELERIAD